MLPSLNTGYLLTCVILGSHVINKKGRQQKHPATRSLVGTCDKVKFAAGTLIAARGILGYPLHESEHYGAGVTEG